MAAVTGNSRQAIAQAAIGNLVGIPIYCALAVQVHALLGG